MGILNVEIQFKESSLFVGFLQPLNGTVLLVFLFCFCLVKTLAEKMSPSYQGYGHFLDH